MSKIGLLPLLGGASVGAALGGMVAHLFALPSSASLSLAFALTLVWSAGAGALAALLLRRLARDGVSAWAESARWLFIAATAGFVAWPFRGAGMVGAGDAHWYTVVLADYVAQVRAGVFPVWVGQSEYGFNGSVYPLRVAPYFQHAGGWVDLLTGRQLFCTEIKNLVLVLHFALAGVTGYLLFNHASQGRQRTLAAALTALWLVSPGMLAPVYGGDQYMTFMALPYLPLLLLGWWRWAAGQALGKRLVGGSLAILLWCHTPIALLSLVASALFFGVLMIYRRRWRNDLRDAAVVAAFVLALGSYPIASYTAVDNRAPASGKPESVINEIKRAWPGYFIPFRAEGPRADGYQFGFALLGLSVAAIGTIVWKGNSAERATGAVLVTLIVCISPVPGITARLWSLVPPNVIGVMNIWPQQRFIPLCTVLGFGLFSAALVHSAKRERRIFTGLMMVAGLWTLHQAHLVRGFFEMSRIPAQRAKASLDPDHVILTRYSFSSFATPNPYFSHGYMDPRLENRLLDPATGRVLASNLESAAPRVLAGEHPRCVSHGRLSPEVLQNEGRAIELAPTLHLARGTAYALRWEPEQSVDGTLIVYGNDSDVPYNLPYSGDGLLNPLGFGSAETSHSIIPRRVTNQADEALKLSFFSRVPLQSLYVRYSLFQIDPDALPIRVTGLVPLRAHITTDMESLWETPRMWQSGWQATVNGQPVAAVKTLHDLVGIPLPPGSNHVEVTYQPPLCLRLHYGTTFLAWSLAIFWLCLRATRWLIERPFCRRSP